MSLYIYRYFILVQWDKIHVANNQAKAWDIDTGGESTFGNVRLSADGQEPTTYTACNTLAVESMKNGILNAMGSVPFYELYQLLQDGTIQRRDGNSWVTIAVSGDFAEVALADAGLMRIEEIEIA